MTKTIITLIIVALSAMAAVAKVSQEAYQLYDVSAKEVVGFSQVLPRLLEKRIVLVGEHHNNEDHHKIQLKVIEALHESGKQLAIGMEMFRAESQEALNQWHRGEMTQKRFQRLYYENWNFPWPLYGKIFNYAERSNIPLVGLNVPSEITRQVARKGFESLSKDQRQMLPDITCDVSPDYMSFIKRAYGAHAHGKMNFDNFCEAQLVWDKAMAIHALNYLKDHPNYSMVLIAGTGHAWRRGIPEEIRQRSRVPYAVILPHVPKNIEPGRITVKDADYIWLDQPK